MSTTSSVDDDSYAYTTLDDAPDDDSSDGVGGGGRDLSKVLRAMEKAAYSAGEIALATAGKIAVKETKANARDLVTESDVACQRLIEEVLRRELSFEEGDGFLGEEDVDIGSGGGDSSSSDASSDALRRALGMAEGGEGDGGLLFVVVSRSSCICIIFRRTVKWNLHFTILP